MLKIRSFLFPFIFLVSCHSGPKEESTGTINQSIRTTIFSPPVKTPAKWVLTSTTKPKPRIQKNKFSFYKEPFFYVSRFASLKKEPDSLLLPFESLPSKPLLASTLTRKIFPRIIKLGKPKKTKASLPLVEDLATCGLMQLSVDEGLPATSVAGSVQDKEGRLWIATEHGLCLYDGEYFYSWFKRNGISRDELRFIFKDSREHLWVGGSGVDEIIPSEGIVKHYSKLQGINHGITSVREDRSGKIIFGSLEGIEILDPATDSLTYYGPDQGLTKTFVNTLTVDNKGRLWLALNGGGVDIVDRANKKVYFLKDSNGLSNNDIRDIMQDKAGNIWMGGWNGGVDYYNPESGKFIMLKEKNGLCHRYIRCLTEDDKGFIWIGSLGGLDIYNPMNRKLWHAYGKTGIVKSDCRNVIMDSYNRMWISTGGGGLLLLDETKGSKDNFNTKWRYAKAGVNTTLEDADGNYWIGTAGLGLDVYKVKAGTLEHLHNEDWTDGWLNKLYDDSLGNLWMVTDYRLDKLQKSTGIITSWGTEAGLPNETIRSFLPIKKGQMFLGTSGGLDKFDTLSGMFSHLQSALDPCKNLVNAIAFAPNGHLWIATNAEGLFELDTSSMQLKHYGKNQGLNKTFIYSMIVDKAGKIWMGTGGDGLKILDPVNNSLIQLTSSSGLAEMTIVSLLERDGKVYAGTVKGLSVIEKAGDNFNIANYDKPQGFEANDFNQNAVMLSKDGKIWYGVGEALTIFDPGNEKKISGKTFITSVDVMEIELAADNKKLLATLKQTDTLWVPARDTFYFKSTMPADTGYFTSHGISWKSTEGSFNMPVGLTLPYHQDHLTFHFSSNFLTNTNRTSYRYILEGADHDWNVPTPQTYADYRNLAPGNYTFKVCSNNFDGTFTELSTFSFTILPPWWKTYLAYAIYALFFITLVIGYNKLRTRQLLTRQRELEQNVKERTFEIEKQKDQIEHQKQLVEEKQKEIVDSITYAKRIQYALLAHGELLQKNLKDLFILFQPKDIVSGDFYWATSVTSAQNPTGNNELFYLAVCDSTGHGVPGAFMSLLNISFLNEAINEKKIYSPDLILNYVRQRLIDNLSQDGARDGMDGILICFNQADKTITYAAANNAPLLYRNNSLIDLPYNKMPVGKGEKLEPFTLF
nr:SpoIIE family protein phosphatase [Bacteroidota bacterium]